MNFKSKNIIYIGKSTRQTLAIDLVKEEPLSIWIQGKPYMVIMRTPGNEKAHTAGLCLAEGIVNKPEDISSIGLCDGTNTNVITITLTEPKRSDILNTLERKSYMSNTSCGICGKEIISDMMSTIKPIKNNFVLDRVTILKNISCFDKYQPLRKKTSATHCAVIYDKDSNFLSSAEDVGRHNALDKSIGLLFLNGTLNDARMVFLTSRISYELVQKAARARIPIISAISRPTSLAVDLATKLNITLATLSPNNGLIVYCNSHRLSG